ncbi:MAG: FHA domain-containing protein [Planctomycetota bacterium]
MPRPTLMNASTAQPPITPPNGAANALSLRLVDPVEGDRVYKLPATPSTIGGGPRCHVRVAGAGIKPLHCVVTPKQAGATVRCWANDTRLNGQPFTEAELNPGDQLSVAGVDLVFETQPTETAAVETQASPADTDDVLATPVERQPVEHKPIEQPPASPEPVSTAQASEPNEQPIVQQPVVQQPAEQPVVEQPAERSPQAPPAPVPVAVPPHLLAPWLATQAVGEDNTDATADNDADADADNHAAEPLSTPPGFENTETEPSKQPKSDTAELPKPPAAATPPTVDRGLLHRRAKKLVAAIRDARREASDARQVVDSVQQLAEARDARAATAEKALADALAEAGRFELEATSLRGQLAEAERVIFELRGEGVLADSRMLELEEQLTVLGDQLAGLVAEPVASGEAPAEPERAGEPPMASASFDPPVPREPVAEAEPEPAASTADEFDPWATPPEAEEEPQREVAASDLWNESGAASFAAEATNPTPEPETPPAAETDSGETSPAVADLWSEASVPVSAEQPAPQPAPVSESPCAEQSAGAGDDLWDIEAVAANAGQPAATPAGPSHDAAPIEPAKAVNDFVDQPEPASEALDSAPMADDAQAVSADSWLKSFEAANAAMPAGTTEPESNAVADQVEEPVQEPVEAQNRELRSPARAGPRSR